MATFTFSLFVANRKMDALVLFIVLSMFLLHCGHFMEAKSVDEKISQNKTYREVEPFTTILLNNESFSIAPDSKYPIHKSDAFLSRRKGFRRTGKIHHQKANNGLQHDNGYKNTELKSHRGSILSSKNIVDRNAKNFSKQHHDKLIKYLNNSRSLKKLLHKRHFDKPIGYYYNSIKEIKRSDYGPTYRFELTQATKPPKNNFNKSFQATARNFDEKSSASNQKNIFEDLNPDPWQNAEHLTTTVQSTEVRSYAPLTSSLAPISLDSPNSKQDNLRSLPQNGRNSKSSWLNQNGAMNSYRNGDRSTIRTTLWSLTAAPFRYATTFRQADTVQRNLAAAQKEKQDKKGKDNLSNDEFESGDTVITFDVTCDQTVNQTCILQRELGDAVTLTLKIKSSKKPDSFQVRWMKVYHKFDSDQGTPLEIEPEKLPWNMVSGSEGRQLRLNPVTNSDTDPNCFVAKVFLISKKHGKMLFTQLKNMIFRIDIPIIDMGKLYAGEELAINIENFMSLPERGNLLFQWSLETKPREYQSLPSNIKVSHSGRSMVLKELKKGRLGVLNCVVYSSNRYAVAKRRFNILNIVENLKRRSSAMTLGDDPLMSDLERTRRCRHIIRRSQEKAEQRLIDGNKPRSRKKRFKRMESRSSEIDCEPLRKKMYSRWVRSLLRQVTTEDPRLMPLEKLFELSEEGDGTLDDVIPHEVHYVSPEVKLVSGTSAERSVDRPISTNCTTHYDCGENAVCVFSEDQTNSTVRSGNCYCRPEFYRDRTTCRKIPSSNHREKRLRRNARNDFAVPQHLFYENSREIAKSTSETLEDEDIQPPKVLAFEEEESFLLTDCIDDKDCSMHANCVQSTNGHPYCKCRPGFRGNGIFCWEMMDYVPASEQFLKDEEEIDILDESPLLSSEISQGRMPVKTAESQDTEEGF